MKMKTPFFLVVSVLFFLGIMLIIGRAVLAQNPDDGWQVVAPGIEYQKFILPAPNHVYVARMERNNPDVTLDSTIAQGRLSGGLERVSGMFNRYEDTINYWGESWGKRNDVVVAINGYFYGPDHEPPGVPWRGQIHSGWYAKRFDNLENGSGFVWKLNRQAFIGECVYHEPTQQIITFPEVPNSTPVQFKGINIPRGSDQLILYTPQFDANTLTDNNGLEVLVEMKRPTLVLPPTLFALPGLEGFLDWREGHAPVSRDPNAEARGIVRQIRDGQGSTSIPFDHIVLSATGAARTQLLEYLADDMEIGVSQAIKNFSDEDCATPLTGKDWTKAYASVGGSFYFLKNNVINGFPGNPQATTRNARTAIAYNDDYIFFIVVDWFNIPNTEIPVSVGMTMTELGLFVRDTLGATYGIAQDGGGSSTMVIHGAVVNTPRHNPNGIVPVPCDPVPTVTPTPIGAIGTPNYLPLIINAAATPLPTPTPPASICYQGEERFVANGMMMVALQPMITSTLFIPDQIVTTTVTANLRLGPGTNYAVLTTLPAGSTGIVKATMNNSPPNPNLNGVYATGTYWWRVNFGGGNVGWISESVLTGGG